ncbi:hypothetical protein IGI04_029903 [Brassica rapa subsp. trilocularis]|uniref:Uncharacterized protein n=1 Tax=Brassica rapa subsp. trilocularis TaxID=1813537 RepID=A0ABQ7LQ13_BRACM|nr:hypothetical protein IGI04_029903 [Brassica rapa subsp. trilocularis]
MNLMREKQLVVGPPSKKRRWHRSEFVAVVTGLEIGGSVVVLSSEGEEFEVVVELCQSKALTSLQCSSLLCPLIDTPKMRQVQFNLSLSHFSSPIRLFILLSSAKTSTMNLMRKKQLVVGPPSKKRRWHKSEFVAVVTGLEIGGSVVVLSSEGEEFEVVMELCQSKALTSLQCSSLLCPLIDTPKARFTEELYICLARGSYRGLEGLSINDTALVSIDTDSIRWAGPIS